MGDQYPGTLGQVAGIIACDERRRPRAIRPLTTNGPPEWGGPSY